MGNLIQLTAEDGFTFDAYASDPSGTPRAGLLVIQEIFGVNSHMRRVADSFAEDGYKVILPALFDRAQKNVQLGYTQQDIAAGRDFRAKVDWPLAVMDMRAAIKALRASGQTKIGAVGYCWGGSLAWLTATRTDVDAAVCYYGGQIGAFKDERATCPVMMHFGDRDASIPLETVEQIKAAQPKARIHVYSPAGHGFNCEQRADYSPIHAKIALGRTLDFFTLTIG
jgi:carboxymethylenebutenolidase